MLFVDILLMEYLKGLEKLLKIREHELITIGRRAVCFEQFSLPFFINFPNTLLSRGTVEQFHLWSFICRWHSSTPSLAPFPVATMTSGFSQQSCRWMLTKPGMLLHMIMSSDLYTWDINLIIWWQHKLEVNDCDGWLFFNVRAGQLEHKFNPTGMSYSRTTDSYIVITYHQWEVETTKHRRRTRAKNQEVNPRMLGVTRSYIASVSWFSLVRFRVIISLLHLSAVIVNWNVYALILKVGQLVHSMGHNLVRLDSTSEFMSCLASNQLQTCTDVTNQPCFNQ